MVFLPQLVCFLLSYFNNDLQQARPLVSCNKQHANLYTHERVLEASIFLFFEWYPVLCPLEKAIITPRCLSLTFFEMTMLLLGSEFSHPATINYQFVPKVDLHYSITHIPSLQWSWQSLGNWFCTYSGILHTQE